MAYQSLLKCEHQSHRIFLVFLMKTSKYKLSTFDLYSVYNEQHDLSISTNRNYRQSTVPAETVRDLDIDGKNLLQMK